MAATNLSQSVPLSHQARYDVARVRRNSIDDSQQRIAPCQPVVAKSQRLGGSVPRHISAAWLNRLVELMIEDMYVHKNTNRDLGDLKVSRTGTGTDVIVVHCRGCCCNAAGLTRHVTSLTHTGRALVCTSPCNVRGYPRKATCCATGRIRQQLRQSTAHQLCFDDERSESLGRKACMDDNVIIPRVVSDGVSHVKSIVCFRHDAHVTSHNARTFFKRY